MSTIENINEQFQELQGQNGHGRLWPIEQQAFETFKKLGIPTAKHEEWKYTRVGNLFNKDYQIQGSQAGNFLKELEFESLRLPFHQPANELVFVNGVYSNALSKISSKGIE